MHAAGNALPIDAHIAEILDAVKSAGCAVVVAPPGSGKTTRLPPALLSIVPDEQKVLLLQPRRIAARAAAERIAVEQGWVLGQQVGYHVRFEKKSSDKTRLLILTEGLLTRWLQSDPLLQGVGAVVLDEFHERSIHCDLCIALLREVIAGVRPDLKLVVMSATLSADTVAAYLLPLTGGPPGSTKLSIKPNASASPLRPPVPPQSGLAKPDPRCLQTLMDVSQDSVSADAYLPTLSGVSSGCPIVHVETPTYPLTIEYAQDGLRDGRSALNLESQVTATVRRSLASMAAEQRNDGNAGDVLVFLPGLREIDRCAQAFADASSDSQKIQILKLHGSLTLSQQSDVLQRTTKQRVIFSTNVAETSLTIDGVRAVVDSGLVRQLQHDGSTGLDRLDTVRISRASADQRAGRAARQAPGVAYRLWTHAQQHELLAYTIPEIRRQDLVPLILEVLAWGSQPAQFQWFEAPQPGAVQRGLSFLRDLGATELGPGGNDHLTELGQQLRLLPLHPRIGALLYYAHRWGCLAEGAAIAALLNDGTPRGFRAAGQRQSSASGASDVLEALAQHRNESSIKLIQQQLIGQARDLWGAEKRRNDDETVLLRLLFCAYPDRVVRRRALNDPNGMMVGGRGVVLSTRSAVQHDEFFVAVTLDDGGVAAQVKWASAIDPAWLETQSVMRTVYDEKSQRVLCRKQTCYRDLVIAEQSQSPDPTAAEQQLLVYALKNPTATLTPSPEVMQWIYRVALLTQYMPEQAWPPASLQDVLSQLLPQLVVGCTSMAELRAQDLSNWLNSLLSQQQQQTLARHAPLELTVPSGRSKKLEYQENGPPILAVKLQELFGLTETPKVASGRVNVLLHLLSPNGRPVQVTQDLTNFWKTTYTEVRKELRQRYPKHPWPEDPFSMPATALTTRKLRG